MLTTTATLAFLLIASALIALAVHEMLGSGRKKGSGVTSAELRQVERDVKEDVESLDAALGGMEIRQQELVGSLDQRFMELSLIHISEPTRPRLISYAVFCLKKKK